MTTENRFSGDKNKSYADTDQRCLNGDCENCSGFYIIKTSGSHIPCECKCHGSENNKMLAEDKRPLPAKISRSTKSKKRRSEIEAQGDSDIAAGIQKSITDPEYYARKYRSEGSE